MFKLRLDEPPQNLIEQAVVNSVSQGSNLTRRVKWEPWGGIYHAVVNPFSQGHNCVVFPCICY